MRQDAYRLFATPLGFCGIVWKLGDSVGQPPLVTCLQLPEATKKLTGQKIAAHARGGGMSVPPPRIAAVIKKVQQHLGGELQEFQDINIDLDGASPFAQQVYNAARKIPAGQTMTYGELARAIGKPKAARAVGQALGANPIPLIIPCHRVLAAGGKPGGFSAPGGLETKARLLALEGVVPGSPTGRKRLVGNPPAR